MKKQNSILGAGVFNFSIFLSSALLFSVQLIFGKMFLPFWGSVPQVWISSLFFYQLFLLLGYLYAHLLSTHSPFPFQMLCHLFILFVGALFLPWGTFPVPSETALANPILGILSELTISISLPFFALSANSIFLQKWVAATLPAEKEAYSLYRYSNMGSLLGLLSYPFLIEPNLKLTEQRFAWSLLYLFSVGLVLASASIVWMKTNSSGNKSFLESVSKDVPLFQEAEKDWKIRIRWVLLALIPSSMLLGTTTSLTTDLSPFPLLWVLPLSIYLFSFVFVFSKKIPHSHQFFYNALPILLLPLLVFALSETVLPFLWTILWHSTALFFGCVALHGELSVERPESARLGEFYFCIALGGALGGLFNGLLAPLLFNSSIEVAIALIAACLVSCRWNFSQFHRGISLFLITFFMVWLLKFFGLLPDHLNLKNLGFLIFVSCMVSAQNSKRYGLTLLFLLLASFFAPSKKEEIIFRKRSFFGIHQVKKNSSADVHLLLHGNTVHGAQKMNTNQKPEPLTYYHPSGPLGDIFSAKNPRTKVAVIGLGAGSMAAYAQKGEEWNFYEIDPAVKEIAQNEKLFSFLKDCKASYQIVLGDARIQLAKSKLNSYDLLFLDAFSSDSIPLHLLTKEALQLYMGKLKKEGWLVLHLSNRHLNLIPVTKSLANTVGLEMTFKNQLRLEGAKKKFIFSSIWAVVAKDKKQIQPLKKFAGWKQVEEIDLPQAWTDDFSNLFSMMK